MASWTTATGIDPTIPSTARMYDFWLGGDDHFAVDRTAALAVSEAAPEVRLMAVESRKFLRRAVRYLAAEADIVQFLDIGRASASRAEAFTPIPVLGRVPATVRL